MFSPKILPTYAGNLFPVTEGAYLQDSTHRLTLLVDHATGAASPRPGTLEVIVDKRTAYDDGRGMGEGVLDSRYRTAAKTEIYRYSLSRQNSQKSYRYRGKETPELY